MKNINMLMALTDNITVDNAKCVACGECVERCILDNLRLKLPPCSGACPLGLNARGYVNLIARGEEGKALDVLYKTLPFPGILGRICSQPCEEKCHHNVTEKSAVSIRALKRYLADTAGMERPYTPVPGVDTGKKVAVVGAGPAGLMAAHDLRIRGHAVTLYDAGPEPGGMLRWGIPEFRLPVDVVRRETGSVMSMGVDFRGGIMIGRDPEVSDLVKEYDAVVLATGCGESRKLDFGLDPGKAHYGLDFLRSIRTGRPPKIGERVVVIGGGNVAVDAAQSALRLGARSVNMVCLESEEEMPAFPWALDDARAEGIATLPSWGPLRAQSDRGTTITIEFQRCSGVYDDQGRFNPCFDSCQTMTLEAETVIIAAGQRPDDGLFKKLGIDTAFDMLTLQTAVAKVFAAGDCATGPASVVEAFASGRRAAESADRFLNGEHLGFGRSYEGPVVRDYEIDTAGGVSRERAKVSRRRFGGKGDFKEIEGTLTAEAARAEAARCYSCGGAFGMHRTCWFCLPCEIECPEKAIWVEIPYLLR